MGLKTFAAATLISVAASLPAAGAVIMNIWEDGADVRAQVSGTLDVSGHVSQHLATATNYLSGSAFVLGREGSDAPVLEAFVFDPPGAPTSFGGFSANYPDVSTGTDFGMSLPLVTSGGATFVYLAPGHTANTPINTGALFAGTSLAALSLVAGDYVFNLPADTITLRVGAAPQIAAVPLPAGGALLAAGIGLLAFGRRRARR